jgi:GNAT superfamily N-acetyltransferase
VRISVCSRRPIRPAVRRAHGRRLGAADGAGIKTTISDHFGEFIEDTLVADRARRQGVGKRLVALATEEAKGAGCEWLHVDFDDHLKSFYLDDCGFRPTSAGLIQLR